MRKFLIFTMAFLLPFLTPEMRADEEVQIKKIPLWRDRGPNLHRDLIIVPIESYYYGAMGSVCTSFVGDLGEVELIVTNTFTGESWNYLFDSASEPQTLLPISGSAGYYEVEYITESGDVYVGEFLIE